SVFTPFDPRRIRPDAPLAQGFMESVETLQAAVEQLLEGCRVVTSQHEDALTSTLRDLSVQASTSDVLSACQRLGMRPGQVSRRLLMTEGPPFAESHEPVLNFLIVSGSLLVLAVIWECVVLRSSLGCCRSREGISLAQIIEQIKDLGGRLANFLLNKSTPRPHDETSDEDADDADADNQMSEAQVEDFWKKLGDDAANQEAQCPENAAAEVGFSHLNFIGKASEGKAVLELYRSGDVSGELMVKLQPHRSSFQDSDEVAVIGKDYEFKETLVCFPPYETTAEVVIPLKQPGKHTSTEYFEVELIEVVKGAAKIGGPTLGLEKDTQGSKVRVHIFYDHAFPYNIPVERQQSKFWVVWYYLQERRVSRGLKWWKTLLGLLYDPIHTVCVTAMIQKIVLDTISDPSIEGNKPWELAMLGFAQFASAGLLRAGDKLATENRGRTGGTRMVHRRQLFAKLLMLSAEEMAKVEGHWWFYVGVNNVDLMAKDLYYQGFVVLQSGFGLLLSIVMQFYVQLSKSDGTTTVGEYLGRHAVPGIFMICMVMLCSVLICRFSKLSSYLKNRMAGEAAWVDSFSWLCHAGVPLESLASRSRARVDVRFAHECKYFTSIHVKTRDYSNDTLWYVKWLVNLSYVIVLVLGAKALLESREQGLSIFQSGDFVFQLKVFSSFGKYLVKINASVIKIFSASVGLKQFIDLVNWPEKTLLQSKKNLHDVSHKIVFETDGNFRSTNPELLARSNSRTIASALEIPLGRVVRVSCKRERVLANFLCQVSELKVPKRGCIHRPKGIQIAYVPAVALHTPHATVLEELQGGCPKAVAVQLAQLFQLNPKRRMLDLQAGQGQMVALLLAMFRNPDVLVLDRPCAFLTPGQQGRLAVLLALWQGGGAEMLLHCLTGQKRCFRREHTLIVTSQVDPALPGHAAACLQQIFLRACMMYVWQQVAGKK
ncbi:unnamed protein product, partial [Effrenium voratum]